MCVLGPSKLLAQELKVSREMGSNDKIHLAWVWLQFA